MSGFYQMLGFSLLGVISIDNIHSGCTSLDAFPRLSEVAGARAPATEKQNATQAMPGDLNGDGVVNLGDLGRQLASYGLCLGSIGFDAASDVNQDGCVTLADLGVVLTAFGSGGGNSTGLIPLIDMRPGDLYKGVAGQLYDGSNEPPAAHLQAAISLANSAVPLNNAGNVAADGRIVMATFGFSNPHRESKAFMDEISVTPGLNPDLLVVNCCRAGEATVEMSDPATTYWEFADQELARAGVSPAQVQFAWLKQVRAFPGGC